MSKAEKFTFKAEYQLQLERTGELTISAESKEEARCLAHRLWLACADAHKESSPLSDYLTNSADDKRDSRRVEGSRSWEFDGSSGGFSLSKDGALLLCKLPGTEPLNLLKVGALSDEAAAVLARCEKCLELPDLETLSLGAAQALAEHRQVLKISEKAISSEVARALAGYKGSELWILGTFREEWRLSGEAVEALAGYQGALRVQTEVARLTPGAIGVLSKHVPALALTLGADELSPLLASALTGYRGKVRLQADGLAPEAVGLLANYRGAELELAGQISGETVAALAGCTAKITFSGNVTKLSPEAAEILAGLAKDQPLRICAEGLTAAAAERLASCKGRLQVEGRRLTPAVARALTGYAGKGLELSGELSAGVSRRSPDTGPNSS